MPGRNIAALLLVLPLIGCGDPQERAAVDQCIEYGSRALTNSPDAEWDTPTVFAQDDRSWIVRGTVQTVNAYGARRELPFSCRVETTGGSGLVRDFELAGRQLGLDAILERD